LARPAAAFRAAGARGGNGREEPRICRRRQGRRRRPSQADASHDPAELPGAADCPGHAVILQRHSRSGRPRLPRPWRAAADAGKAGSMLAVMGLLPWTATVTVDRMSFGGRDLLKMSPAERRKIVGKDMSMIFQEPMVSLNPCFTVGFQIEEVLPFHMGMDRAQRRARAIELLKQVGIPEPEERLSSFPHQMSGGQCQRVMIAIAIACNPKLLIADEPTTALDVTIQKQILDLLVSLQAKYGMGLIMITHTMDVV